MIKKTLKINFIFLVALNFLEFQAFSIYPFTSTSQIFDQSPDAPDVNISEIEEKLKTAGGNKIREYPTRNLVELYDDNGFKYIQKIYDHTLDLSDSDPESLASQDSNRYTAYEELFAYKLSQKLKLKLIPPTIIYPENSNYILRQFFIDESIPAKKREVEGLNKMNSPLIIFDYLIGHIDRNNNNFLLAKDGSIYGFDNESILIHATKKTSINMIKVERKILMISTEISDIENKIIDNNKLKENLSQADILKLEKTQKLLNKKKIALISEKQRLQKKRVKIPEGKSSLFSFASESEPFKKEDLMSFFFEEEVWDQFNSETNWEQWFDEHTSPMFRQKTLFNTEVLESMKKIFMEKKDLLSKKMKEVLRKEGKEKFFKSAQELRIKSMNERKDFYQKYFRKERKFYIPSTGC
jgi:hypothetical protein